MKTLIENKSVASLSQASNSGLHNVLGAAQHLNTKAEQERSIRDLSVQHKLWY